MKRLAIGYAIKTLILAIACLVVPDLPARALRAAQAAWSQLASSD